MTLRRAVALLLCPELRAQIERLNEANARMVMLSLTKRPEPGKPQPVAFLKTTLEIIMHSLEDLLAQVGSEKTKIESLIALTNGLHQKVRDALGSSITPSQQMRIDQIFDAAQSNADEIDAAINANTDAPVTTDAPATIQPDPSPAPATISGDAGSAGNSPSLDAPAPNAPPAV